MRRWLALILAAQGGCAAHKHFSPPAAPAPSGVVATAAPAVTEFQGEYRWLSNFWPCKVEIDGIVYPSAEHAYQGAKTLDMVERRRIAALATASAAKAAGRALRPVRADWDTARFEVMERVVRGKFAQNRDLRARLLATGDAPLVEGNMWGDTVWGVYRGEGENRLGQTLMRVRAELRDGR